MTTAAGYWDAAEAISWIAFGEAKRLEAWDDFVAGEYPDAEAAQATTDAARAKLRQAQADLTTALALGKLVAWGIRCDADFVAKKGAEPEVIPPAVLALRDSRDPGPWRTEGTFARTITPNSRVAPPVREADGHTEFEDILQPRGVFFRDVFFAEADVRKLWSRHDAAEASAPRCPSHPAPPPPALSNRRRMPNNSRAAEDAALLPRMREMIANGEARGPYDAGLILAGVAAGFGSAESKAKRLAKRLIEADQADGSDAQR